jgi:hypothetical protein
VTTTTAIELSPEAYLDILTQANGNTNDVTTWLHAMGIPMELDQVLN